MLNDSLTILSKQDINKVFYLIFFANVLLNMNIGSIPSSVDQIKKDINVDYYEIGLFGTLQFAGNTLGSIVSLFIIESINRMKMCYTVMFIHSILLVTFGLIKNTIVLMINRTLGGLFMSFITIYSPVWVDQYAHPDSKAILMAFFSFSSILGTILGFLLTSFLGNHISWEYSFYTQSLFALAIGIKFLLSKEIYFRSGLRRRDNDSDIFLNDYDLIDPDLMLYIPLRCRIISLIKNKVILYDLDLCTVYSDRINITIYCYSFD